MLAVACTANSGGGSPGSPSSSGSPGSSVSSNKTSSASSSSNTSGPKPLSQRLEEKTGYKQTSNGAWVPQSNQRSSFEKKGKSPYFQGEYQKKSYQTEGYAKKSWWGNKDYGRKEYENDKDGSHFQKNSRFDNQGAPESGAEADLPGAYQTNNYATHSAREASKGKLAKPSNTQTDTRRKVYPAPEIIDWRQQRTLSLEQSKGLLGH